MPIYDNTRETIQTTAAPAGSVSNWTVDDIRKSDILVFRESATEYIDTVVAPNGFQVGLLDEAFLTDLLVTGHITGSGVIYSELGFSGSLQTLTDGSNYLQGSGGITVTNNANGSITIASSSGDEAGRQKSVVAIAGTVSAGTVVPVTSHALDSFNSTTIDVFLNGDLLLQGTQSQVNAGTHDFYTVADSSGAGQLKFRYDVTSSDELIVITGSSSGGGGGGTTYTAGTALSLAGAQFNVDIDNVTITENGSNQLQVVNTPGTLVAGNGINSISFNGSSNSTMSIKPVTGSPITVSAAGVGLDITSMSAISLNSADELLVSQSGTIAKTTVNDIVSLVSAGASAPTNATYLVLSADSTLSNERVLAAGSGVQITDGGAGNNLTVSAVVESSGGLKFVSGKLAVRVADFIGFGLSDNAGSIDVNVSALAGSGLTTDGNQLALDFSQVAAATNQITVNAGDGLRLGGTATIGNAASAINLEIDSADVGGLGTSISNNNIDVYLSGTGGIQILTGSDGDLVINGTTGQIGAAEDGDYTDGLYTDFTSTTPTGTAIDRFNELLKYLVPKAAPTISSIDLDTAAGVTGNLSFGASNVISGVASVSSLGDLAAVDVNGIYTSETSSNGNIRAGVYSAAIELTGDIASATVTDLTSNGATNYPAKSFGKANLGSLILELNGTNLVTIDLTSASTGAGASSSGTGVHVTSGSGFFELSAITDGKYSSGDPYTLEKHRTGKWKIAAAAQREGVNYLKIKHIEGASTYSSSYVQWVVDSIATNGQISLGTSTLSSLSLSGSRYLSGIKYYTAGTATYAVAVNNFYTNIYGTSNIVIDSSEIAAVNITPPSINHGGGQDESKSMTISQTVTIDATSILNDSLNASISIVHPIKTAVTSGAVGSLSSILLYNATEAAAAILKVTENMNGESYRLESGAYGSQSDVSSGAYDSTTSLVSSTGLQVWNQKLVAPTQSSNGGNFSTITNGPAGNPNYSGLTTGTKTYFRKFTNNKGGSSSNFTLEIDGTGTIVDNTTSLNGNNLQIFMRVPGVSGNTTGWLDLASSFSVGAYSDNDGCYVQAFDSSLNSSILFTSGIKFVENNSHIVIKIVADGSWTGNVDELRFIWR